MKTNLKIFTLALAATFLFSLSATAQWTSNATSVFLSNANKNVGLGTSTPNAPLQLANFPLQNRKIVLFEDANSEHAFFGFGINPAAMRYQVGNNSSHVFYASNSAGTASVELLRIKSSGDVGLEHLDEPYGVGQLARDLHLSESQLCRKLKALGTASPALFVRSHRLGRAATLLTTTDLPIAEIGYRTGFNDPAYFANCFHKEFGKSPSEWRKG